MVGNDAAMHVMMGMALAIANRDHEDPRGALAELFIAAQKEVSDSIRKFEGAATEAQTEVVVQGANSAIEGVRKIADAFLGAMGAPPAQDA